MRKKHRITLILGLGTLLAILAWAATAPNKSGEAYEITWRDKLCCDFDHLMVKLHLRRPTRSMSSCLANLKQIDGAKATWALENKKTNTDIPSPTELYGPNNYIRDVPECPGGGTYFLGPVQRKPTCTIPGHTL